MESFADADVIFSGRVVDVFDPKEGRSISSMDPITYTFEVTHVWKGQPADVISVASARRSASCGFLFDRDEHYFVFAQEWRGALHTGLCVGNAPFDAAVDKRFLFGEPLYSRPRVESPLVSFDQLVNALDDEDRWVRQAAAAGLVSAVEYRDAVVPLFRAIIRGERSGDRARVMQSLADLQPEAALFMPDLVCLWNEGNPHHQWAAFRTIMQIGYPSDWLPLLLDALRRPRVPFPVHELHGWTSGLSVSGRNAAANAPATSASPQRVHAHPHDSGHRKYEG